MSLKTDNPGKQLRFPLLDRGHRQADWGELFYDLAYVVVVSQAAHLLIEQPSFNGAFNLILAFGPIWWCWMNQLWYSTRFHVREDRPSRFFLFVQLIFIIMGGVLIYEGLEKNLTLCVACYIVIRILQLTSLWRAGRLLHYARPFVNYFVLFHGIGLSIWFASLTLPPQIQLYGFLCGFIVELSSPFFGASLIKSFPPHTSHLPERIGLFMILILGESFIGLIQGAALQGPSLELLWRIAVGVFIVSAIAWTYFDRLDVPAIENLAKETVITRYFIWTGSHFFLTCALIFAGVGVEFQLIRGHQIYTNMFVSSVLPISVALYLLVSAIIYWAADIIGPTVQASRLGHYLRIVVALSLFSSQWFIHDRDSILVLTAVHLWVVATIEYVMERRTPRNIV
ncbi:low temperature requirement protein A [Microbulbifer marinus]|uniref:Low temperature requirement protein LtrA n=1 Tax=Microbulbifer marinus TaxID=658218 RepID=A0A1H3X2R6_9GAMM|nr:low temperature requirement protein A [Microbulbifer marinus]SDZ92934.1 Low temperature requirement protein LtrA [Microbulbifer marinus]